MYFGLRRRPAAITHTGDMNRRCIRSPEPAVVTHTFDKNHRSPLAGAFHSSQGTSHDPIHEYRLPNIEFPNPLISNIAFAFRS